jgi:hypothetical protein
MGSARFRHAMLLTFVFPAEHMEAPTCRAVPLGAGGLAIKVWPDLRARRCTLGANIRRVDAGQLKSDWRSSDAEKVNVGRFQIPTHERHTWR